MKAQGTKGVLYAIAALIGVAVPGGVLAQTKAQGLNAYADCTFSDGLMIVRTDQLPPEVTHRTVETDDGVGQIELVAGLRIMFAYPLTDFYANVKTERLPAARYSELKKDLMANFQHLAHANTINTSLQSPLHGLEAHGLDRNQLEGGVLGIYLLFDDTAHTATTIYLLNREPMTRKFQTIEEYRALRDGFLNTYTGCIQSNLFHSK
jgi:hypothetical protein